jgi:hypothetical protein
LFVVEGDAFHQPGDAIEFDWWCSGHGVIG